VHSNHSPCLVDRTPRRPRNSQETPTTSYLAPRRSRVTRSSSPKPATSTPPQQQVCGLVHAVIPQQLCEQKGRLVGQFSQGVHRCFSSVFPIRFPFMPALFPFSPAAPSRAGGHRTLCNCLQRRMSWRRRRRRPTRPPRSDAWSRFSTISPRIRPHSSPPRRRPPRTSKQPAVVSLCRRCLLRLTPSLAPAGDLGSSIAGAPVRRGQRRLLPPIRTIRKPSPRTGNTGKPKGPRGLQNARDGCLTRRRDKRTRSFARARLAVLRFLLFFVDDPLILPYPRRLNHNPAR